jgi:uncharacterized protein YndB with AHSA1/START domain
MPAGMTHDIRIRVPADILFEYLTQPRLWHEWHPSSRLALTSHSTLAPGDRFEEVIELRPLAPLPPRLIRQVRYTVIESTPCQSWQVKGELSGGWLRIRYTFEPAEETGAVTRFSRTLTFGTTGVMRPLQPFLQMKMKKISAQAMRNLKTRMERM